MKEWEFNLSKGHRRETRFSGNAGMDDDDDGSSMSSRTADVVVQARDELAGHISRLVSRSGLALSVMLLLTATLVVSLTYAFLTKSRVDEFEKAVREASFAS